MEIIQSYPLWFWDLSYYFYMALHCAMSTSLLGVCSTALHRSSVAGPSDRKRNMLKDLSSTDDSETECHCENRFLSEYLLLLFHNKPMKYIFSVILYYNGFGYNVLYWYLYNIKFYTIFFLPFFSSAVFFLQKMTSCNIFAIE